MSMQPVLKILDLPELESRIEANKLGTSRFLPEDIAISTVYTMRVITELSEPGQLFSGGTTARLMSIAPLNSKQRDELSQIADIAIDKIADFMKKTYDDSKMNLAFEDLKEWKLIKAAMLSPTGGEQAIDLSRNTF